MAGVKALTFDVFGTVVDWRSSVILEGEELSRRKGFDTDWESFADTWRREGYAGGMEKVRRGELPWMKVDALHRIMLDRLLAERRITGLSEEEVDHFNRVWHRLRPWPDVPIGLDRLRARFIVAALSNGNVALLTNMAKNGGFSWDCVLSAEHAGVFKPDPRCYQTAAELLGLRPEQVMMVAAHKADLRAAQAVGFKAAFVLRPDEFGSAGTPDLAPDPSFDYVATDLLDLARQLGC